MYKCANIVCIFIYFHLTNHFAISFVVYINVCRMSGAVHCAFHVIRAVVMVWQMKRDFN